MRGLGDTHGPRRPHRAEDGFMLIEVLVGVLLIGIASVGLLVAINGGRSETSYSELLNTGAALADKEAQRITALKWSEMSLNKEASWTAKTTAPTDPSSYLSAGPCDEEASGGLPQYKPCYAYNWENTAVKEPLVTAATGYDKTEDPYSFSTVAANGKTRISASVYRYITWVNDGKCTGEKNTCGGSNAAKRITVAVTVSGLRKPVILSTLYTNPEGNEKNPLVDGSKCVDGGVEGVKCTY